jgi:hypothetical protein
MKSSTGAKISIVVLYLLIIPGTLFASTLRISWNNNPEPDLCGYNIYYGTISGVYEYVLDVGNSICVDIEGFQEDTVYFITVTAYDFSGNESDFSREVSILIHENLLGRLLAILNGVLDFIGVGWDTTSGASQYSLEDFSETEGYVPVNTASVVRIDYSDVAPAEEFTQGDYLIKDVIIDSDEALNLATSYPSGTYTFVPLTDRASEIIDGIFYSSNTGAYLFMVQDMAGGFINILRVSVVDEFCYEADYPPATGTFLPIDSVGISLFLPESALNAPFPIGIDCGGASSSAMSALFVHEPHLVVFNIVPYGLVLMEPAQISVLYDGTGPVVVEVFDEATKQWIELDDVDLYDGVVTFSTTVLGSFKVYTPPPDTDTDGFSYGNSGGGGGCFIDSLQGIRAETHLNSAYIFLAMIMLGATLHTVSSRKRR